MISKKHRQHILGTNGLNSADVPLSNKQTNKQTSSVVLLHLIYGKSSSLNVEPMLLLNSCTGSQYTSSSFTKRLYWPKMFGILHYRHIFINIQCLMFQYATRSLLHFHCWRVPWRRNSLGARFICIYIHTYIHITYIHTYIHGTVYQAISRQVTI